MHSLQSKHSRFKSSKSQKRFTDYEMQSKYKGSFVETSKPIVSLADRAPFYSSFTEDNVFDIPARTIRNAHMSFKTATNNNTRTNTINNTLVTTQEKEEVSGQNEKMTTPMSDKEKTIENKIPAHVLAQLP